MSTRSNTARASKAPMTNPKWYPTTQGLNRWINKMANRGDLAIRVLRNTGGAPARFVPSEAEIDLNEGLIAGIDPVIAGSPEFVVKHRSTAGALIHEGAHARHSGKIDLAKIHRVFGSRHAATFQMLEEGRCETQQWPYLNGVEKLALQSMVLEIVLRDMEDDEGNTPPIDMRGVVRLAGLLMARMNTGIVDISNPLGHRMNEALIEALDTDYATLYDLAVRFSEITIEYYGAGLDELHDLTKKWMEVEDRILPKGGGDEGGEEGEPTEEGGEPGGEGEGPSEPKDEPGEGDGDGDEPKGEPKGKGKGPKSEPKDKGDDGDGDGDDEGEGDEPGEDGEPKGEGDGEGEQKDTPIGDDDEGTVGDGSRDLSQTDPNSDAALGDYAAFNDANTFEDIFNAVRDAAEEAEKISGSRLREEIVAIHRASASEHAERRRRNAAAMKKWR